MKVQFTHAVYYDLVSAHAGPVIGCAERGLESDAVTYLVLQGQPQDYGRPATRADGAHPRRGRGGRVVHVAARQYVRGQAAQEHGYLMLKAWFGLGRLD